jgi:hypothetical protein
MKCINCQAENNLRDRTNNYGRCQLCNHPFCFEPTDAINNKYRITDGFFQKLLLDISAENRIAYTDRQLHYYLDRKIKKKTSSSLWGWLIMYGTAIVFMSIIGGALLGNIFKTNQLFWLGFPLANIVFAGILYFQSIDVKNSRKNRDTAVSFCLWQGLITIVAGILAGVVFSVAIANTIAILLVAGWTIGMHFYLKSKLKDIPEQSAIEPGQINTWLSRWQSINGAIDPLLPPADNLVIAPAPDPDVTAYSFDRLLVTDRDQIAHFFIANNFHFEHNCAVLSINEYPETVFNTVMEMVRRNPDLQVFALHDCSPTGLELVDRLRTSDRWFNQSSATIIDLGLLPRQVINDRGNFAYRNRGDYASQARQLSDRIRQTLSPAELAWLESGNYVELASFPPLRLLQIVQQNISRSRDLAVTEDGGSVVIFDSYGGSDSGMMYSADSFG